MRTVKFVYWEEDGAWLGYPQDYSDYWTQGETLDEIRGEGGPVPAAEVRRKAKALPR